MRQYATLRNFVKSELKRSSEELRNSLEQVANALADSGEKGLVQLRIIGEQKPRYVSFKLTADQCKLQLEEAEKPNLELVISEKTAWDILEGSLSPLEAFKRGKMRIRGDSSLGKRLLKRLASSPDAQFDICKIGV